jgi:hypothetical protein
VNHCVYLPLWFPSVPLHPSMFPVTFNNRSERGER